MNKLVLFFQSLFMLLVTCCSFYVKAGMIGDTLTIDRLYPNLNSHYQPSVETTVAAGNSDAINAFLHELIDPEDTSVTIQWISSSYFLGSVNVFDGYRFTGFSETIKNVKVSDIFNVSLFDLDFGDDFINLNFDSAFDSSSFLILDVEFAPASVSEPNSIFLFFICSFALMFNLMFRRKQYYKSFSSFTFKF
ncbi:hypothetical protein MN202_01645 [Rheinheimera muenzenbergensis]|uniref:PEP-CTERM protein-sorting domain-containing protein n=1 Tax=Rheinheimera muenzenbergensis TaxID=1193628 RepID=A0ABU8C1Z7_9GAMM